jgi:mannosyl-oligosaccharide alpha-1,2-mannosidase
MKNSTEGFISFPSKHNHHFEHLSCFAGGMLAWGGHVLELEHSQNQYELGVKFTETCYQVYAKSESGLGSEDIDKDSLKGEGQYHLRPEVIESIFYMWRITHDPKYREWGWNIVQSIEKYCRDDAGYHGLKSGFGVVDRMETFLFGETLKYLYLLFADDDLLPLDQYVFNTEAHPLSIRGKGRRKNIQQGDV